MILDDFTICDPDNNILGVEGTPERKQWFLNRVGAMIFRCRYLKQRNVFYVSSFLVKDTEHAESLFDFEYIYPAYHGHLAYFDTRKEADDFGKSLKKIT